MDHQVSQSPFLMAIKTLWCWTSSTQMNKTGWLPRKDATTSVILKMKLLHALPWLDVLDPRMFNSPFYPNMLASPQLSSGQRMEMLKTWRYFLVIYPWKYWFMCLIIFIFKECSTWKPKGNLCPKNNYTSWWRWVDFIWDWRGWVCCCGWLCWWYLHFTSYSTYANPGQWRLSTVGFNYKPGFKPCDLL